MAMATNKAKAASSAAKVGKDLIKRLTKALDRKQDVLGLDSDEAEEYKRDVVTFNKGLTTEDLRERHVALEEEYAELLQKDRMCVHEELSSFYELNLA